VKCEINFARISDFVVGKVNPGSLRACWHRSTCPFPKLPIFWNPLWSNFLTHYSGILPNRIPRKMQSSFSRFLHWVHYPFMNLNHYAILRAVILSLWNCTKMESINLLLVWD